ncbi:hypothetical protein SAMN00790413_06006 [Deinococcus hopiensis KR-140]|uniref:Uncharacterized protein n=1 Tax=Deinococcus hopiensis KR-140 TaxID=695939 RepID=A0A1W1VW84_9DEIO|nr:hypothetical protein SAMN00790413_06006 [Deinococcus hopiensis KR-140]
MVEANVAETTWVAWRTEFLRRITLALGFIVKDAESQG